MIAESGNGENQEKYRNVKQQWYRLNKSVRDTDVDKGIEMDVAARVERIIDRRGEQNDFHENTKKMCTI